MHQAVLDYVGRWATTDPIRVLEIGSRDVNGTPRHLFPNAHYLGIDRLPGPGVDLVDDAAFPLKRWGTHDLVLCLEVFEHSPVWPVIVGTAFAHCGPGGRLVVTCAGPGRSIHSAVDGGPKLHPGEFYNNVLPGALARVLNVHGWDVESCVQVGEDVQATAVKPHKEANFGNAI